MTGTKRIILCADDFGLNSGVSLGIIHLAERRCLSAVSCMVNGVDFKQSANDLLALNNRVQIGWHINLTEGRFLSLPDKKCFGLNELLFKSHARLLDRSVIFKELTAQLDHFVDTMGRLPDFIDGHQHIHQFPVIRALILKLYEQRFKATATMVRSTYPAITLPRYRFKGAVLALTGGKQLDIELNKRAIPHNAYFSGVYDFAPDTRYRYLFRQWLALAPDDTLIMCHPGINPANSDPIASTRSLEYNYFISDDFLNDCHEFNIQRHAQNLESR